MSTAPEYGDVVREVYGDPDALVRELYRPYRPVVKRKRKAVSEPRRSRISASYRVTADARVQCDCGVYVYTERIDGRPPALPSACWRCEKPLPTDVLRQAVKRR